MPTEAEIERELAALVDQIPKLLVLSEKSDGMIKFGTHYQSWYSRALKLVELLGADRLEEFVSYYRMDSKRKSFNVSTYVIQDYVQGLGAPNDIFGNPEWNIHHVVCIRMTNQSQILMSLKSRLSGVLSDVHGHLLAKIEDEELKVAEKLISVNLRAAGAVAGVVLEGHLQRVATNHNISIGRKAPTVSNLNDPLKEADIYDLPTWRRIQHLADIRNLCDHKKGREPEKSEVEDLISGVSTIIKTIH